jgi:hypothetical protein
VEETMSTPARSKNRRLAAIAVSRRYRYALIAVLLSFTGVLVSSGGTASATTYAVYHTTADVSARTSPTAAPGSGYGAPVGAAIAVQCQVIGQPVGPAGNTLYFWVIYAGRSFYVPDTWTDSPHLAGQPPIAGIPMCGTATAPVSSAPLVWIGAPFHGTWPNTAGCAGAQYPSDQCSLPSVHHIVYLGDWAADLQSVATGTPVVLYAAPQDGRTAISAQVERITPACASQVVQYGGYRVTVGLFSGSTHIGEVTYAHINPSVSQGAWISRWGTQLGTIGSYTSNSCWNGPHTHVELYSQTNYACYNRGWAPGQWMNATNFIGFVGGNVASGPRQACL